MGPDQGRGEGRAARRRGRGAATTRRAPSPAFRPACRPSPARSSCSRRPPRSASTGTIRARCSPRSARKPTRSKPRSTAGDHAAAAGEIGDLMFALVNLARHLDVDPEAALRATNAKFERRFAVDRGALAKHGKTPAEATLAEMDALWDEAKAAERPCSGRQRGRGEARPHLTGLGRIGPHRRSRSGRPRRPIWRSLRCSGAARTTRRRPIRRAPDRSPAGSPTAAPRWPPAACRCPRPSAPRPGSAGAPDRCAPRGFRSSRGPRRDSRSILFQTSITRSRRCSSMPRPLSTSCTSRDLRLGVAMRDVAHMQDHVGLDHLLQRRAEGRDQHGRQVGDEADGIGQDDLGAVRQLDRAQRRIERREQHVGFEHPRPRHAVEQRRLAGIGVADQRHDRIRHPLAGSRDGACGAS